MDRCKISKWEALLSAPDRVNIPCLMHDIMLYQIDVRIKLISMEQKRCKILNDKTVLYHFYVPSTIFVLSSYHKDRVICQYF